MQAILERQNGTRSEAVPPHERFSVASAGSDFPESATQAIRMPAPAVGIGMRSVLEPRSGMRAQTGSGRGGDSSSRPRQGVQERMRQEQMRLVASTTREERHRWWVYMKEAFLFAAAGALGVVAVMLLTQPSFLWIRLDELAAAEVSVVRAVGIGILGFVGILGVSVAGRVRGWTAHWNGGENAWFRT